MNVNGYSLLVVFDQMTRSMETIQQKKPLSFLFPLNFLFADWIPRLRKRSIHTYILFYLSICLLQRTDYTVPVRSVNKLKTSRLRNPVNKCIYRITCCVCAWPSQCSQRIDDIDIFRIFCSCVTHTGISFNGLMVLLIKMLISQIQSTSLHLMSLGGGKRSYIFHFSHMFRFRAEKYFHNYSICHWVVCHRHRINNNVFEWFMQIYEAKASSVRV